MVLNKIVVALDGSEMSERVIEALKTLQLGSETKIILAHVLSSSGTAPQEQIDKPHQSLETVYKNIENLLHSYQNQLSVNWETEIEIVSGDPAEEIIRLANIYAADLIALGTRGLKGFKRVIEGSVSSQVVVDAPCSVLVVKPEVTELPRLNNFF